MAQYDASVVVSILTKGEKRLNQIKASVNEINKLSQNLKPINLLAPGGGNLGDSVRAALKPIKDFAREAVNGTQRYSNTLSGATGQAQAFKIILDNVKIAAGGYDKQVADVKAYAAALAGAEQQARELAIAQRDLLTDARIRAGVTPQGQSTLLGSEEAFRARAAFDSEQARKRLKAENEITISKTQQYQLDQRALRTQEKIAQIQKRIEKRQRLREGLQLGVGFPLLFGGGPGSIAGGALGALTDAGGKGFGGQVLFSAIGAQIDEAIKRVRDFGNALKDLNVDDLNDALGTVNAKLASQVDLLIEQGRYYEARAALQKEITQQTGLVGDSTTDVTNAVNLLNKGWREIVNAVSSTLAIIGAPFAAAIGIIASGVAVIVKGINVLFTVIGTLLKRATRFGLVFLVGEENVKRLEKALENIEIKLDEGVRKAREFVDELRKAADVAQFELSVARGFSEGFEIENKIGNERLKFYKKEREILAELEQKYKDINIELKNATSEERIQARQSALDEATAKRQLARLETERQIRKLILNDAQNLARLEASAVAAEAKVLSTPLPDPTPFSRTTPEQDRATAVAQQQIAYEKQLTIIRAKNQSTAALEARLREAAANNDLALLRINKEYTETVKQREEIFISQVSALQSELDIITAVTREEQERLRLEQELQTLKDSNKFTEPQLERIKALKENLNQAQQPLNQFILDSTRALNDLDQVAVNVSQGIGNAIGNSLNNGISSLIEGSTTVKEVFADMLKSIGQILVQEGTKMIATYIAIGIAKIFAGMGSSTPKIGTDTNYFNQGFTPMNFFQPRANGGPVNPNTTYMVGENGPELFRPTQAGRIDSNSDMRSMMSRQRNTAPAMNFTFETTNIGGQEFVSREQLEAAMAVTRRQAASDGAKRGMNMTLDKMQQSPATRRRVGIS